MLKTYIKEKNYSVKDLERLTGIPYSTLNDLVNGKTDINNMRLGHVRKLSDVLQISIEKLVSLCCIPQVKLEKDNIHAEVIVKNKKYYLRIGNEEKYDERPLCKVNPDTTFFLRTFAEWEMEDYINEKEIDGWQPTDTIS